MTLNAIHIAVDGHDANDGGASAPLASAQCAADRMRPGQTCVIHGGIYREAVNVSRCGRAGQPLRFVAAPGDDVVFHGGDPVTVPWEPFLDRIVRTYADGPVEQVFLGYRLLPEARWPALVDPDDMLSRDNWAKTTETAHGLLRDPRVAESGIDWTGAKVTMNVAHGFFSWTRTITGHAAGSDTLRYEANLPGLAYYGPKGKGLAWPRGRYFLFGKIEALTGPGQWYFDEQAGLLYVWPPDDVNLNDPAWPIYVRRRKTAFKISADHVELRGLGFFGCGVQFIDCNAGILEDCDFRYPSATRIVADPSEAAKARADSTIVMRGDDHTITGCTLTQSPGGGLLIEGARGRVENCLIDHVNWNGSMLYAPIWAQGAGPHVIRRCTAGNAGNYIVTTAASPGALIELCEFHDGARAGNDVSLIYTGGNNARGTVYQYNHVHGNHGLELALGIRGDDMTRGVTVRFNVVWDCPWAGIAMKGDHNRIYHNTVFNCGYMGRLWGNRNGRDFAHITIAGEPEPWKPYCEHQKHLEHLDAQNRNSLTFNNIALTIDEGRKGSFLDGDTDRIFNNLAAGPEMLRDPVARDFRPRSGSPAVAAARKVDGVELSDRCPDIGAYAHDDPQPWKPGCDSALSDRLKRWSSLAHVTPPVSQ